MKIYPLDQQNFRILYENGRTLKEIASDTGFCYDAVKNNLNKIGVTLINHGLFRRKYVLNENWFETIDCEKKAYFLGFLLADGSIYKNRIKLTLNSVDHHIIQEFADCIKTNKPVVKRRYPSGDWEVSFLEVSSTKMVVDLSKYGCIPKKTFSVVFPDIEEKYHHHFIRGYFDGDGSFIKTKNRNNQMKMSLVGTILFVTEIQNILMKQCNLAIRTKIMKVKNVYYLNYSGNLQMKRIVDYLYKDATVFLTRKFNKVKHLL